MDWSRTKILAFIEAYRKRPILWCTEHPSHHNRQSKQVAWREIATILNVDMVELRKKTDSLLASFRRAKSEGVVNKNGRSIYLTKWYAFKHLKFLLNRNSMSYEQYEEKQSDDEVVYEESNEILVKQEDHNSDKEDESKEENFPEAVPLLEGLDEDNYFFPEVLSESKEENYLDPIPTSSKRRRIESTPKIQPQVHNNYKDECEAFGNYVATKLKTYNPRTMAIVEHAIMNVFFEASMGRYDDVTPDKTQPPPLSFYNMPAQSSSSASTFPTTSSQSNT